MLIDIKESLLIISDVQEALTPMTISPRKVINGSALLLKAANLLEIPVIITELTPKILGRTIFDIKNIANTKDIFEKETFSALKNDAITEKIRKYNKKQLIICGVETHISVLQTAIDAKQNGYEVFVSTDACSAKEEIPENAIFYRMMSEGINIGFINNIITEWLGKPSHPAYKQLIFR